MLPFADKFITGHYGTLSEYRKRKGMQPHSGTDWARPAGTPIPALTAGTIKLIQFSKILGWVVVQTGWDASKRRTKYIGYCHLYCDTHGAECKGPEQGCKLPVTGLKVGQKVKLGEKLLKVGNSGSATTGSHLHLTLGNTLRSVFGATTAKEDAYLFVKAQIAGSKKEEPKPAAVSDHDTVKTIYACPHCKKELK